MGLKGPRHIGTQKLPWEKNGTPFICGDFNFHVQNTGDFYAKKFCSLVNSKGFKQHVSEPTHVSGNTLDLFLTINSSQEQFPLTNVNVTPCTGTTSDHYLLCCELPVSCSNLSNKKPERESRDMREFQKINVDELREDIFCSPLNLLSDFGSLDEAVDLYKNELTTLLDKHAPSVTKSFKPQQSPWWNEKCQKAKTEMRRAQRRFRKNRNDETKLLFQEKLIDKAIIVNRARDLYFNGKLSSVKGDC